MHELLSGLKRFLHATLRAGGIDVYRIRPPESTQSLGKILAHHDVNVVLDIGANEGQFAQELRRVGYSGRIVSFEPLSVAHQRLVIAASGDPRWTVFERCALSDREGVAEINVSANSVSSSLLPMNKMHLDAAPSSSYVGKESVRITRLDTAVSQLLNAADRFFLKLDVQGFERQVLSGATQTLTRAAGIQLELSTVPLYEGSATYEELLHDLKGHGFQLWQLAPGFTDQATGRLLQFDAVLMRPRT